MSSDHHFLFASLDSKPPSNARKVHIKRLYDILHLSIQRSDFARAKRAWAILIRCKEFRWEEHWATGLHILNEGKTITENIPQRTQYLRAMILRDVDKEMVLKELVLLFILSGQYSQALDELELYLPSFPYQDNPVLHIYAGLLCLYLAQRLKESQVPDNSYLRDAKSHFGRAKSIDPSNAVAEAFLEKVVTSPINGLQKRTDEIVDSENEGGQADNPTLQRKRLRTSISPT